MSNDASEVRFRAVFAHLGAVRAYARRRGGRDPDGIAAEVMTIAWRRLADVPQDDPRPWLYATARHLVWAEARLAARTAAGEVEPHLPAVAAPEPPGLDPHLADALRALSPTDREALLLVAWEELTPAEAARALGIGGAAFRVRLLRARRRVRARLAAASGEPVAASMTTVDVEGT